jgi:selenocysteine lyase/cysteine desulfurase
VGDLPWQPGDTILTSALEHHALARPVAKLVRERHVQHEVIPYQPDCGVDLDFAARRLAQGGVRLLAFCSASNVTGVRLPPWELTELARHHGALSLVDAAQTVGLDVLNFARLGADIVAFTGHKAALGPRGSGGLWAASAVRFESPWAVCEVGTGRAACASFPGYCDTGSVNVAAAVGLARGLDWSTRQRQQMGRAASLANRLRQDLSGRDRVEVFGGQAGAYIPVVSLRLAGLPLERAERYFAEHGLLVRAGQHCAPAALAAIGAPEGTLRVSFGPYNREADVDRFLEALDALPR